MSTPEQDQRLAEEIETYEAMGGEEQTVVWLKELQRRRKASQTGEEMRNPPAEYVVPTLAVTNARWDDPDRFQWPGTVIHRFTTSTGKNVVQFLLKEKKEGSFVLKSWDERFLEGLKP